MFACHADTCTPVHVYATGNRTVLTGATKAAIVRNVVFSK
jgi:hypothetical protein